MRGWQMAFETNRTEELSPWPAASPAGADPLVALIASAFSVDRSALQSLSRGGKRAAFARQVAMYLAHTRLGLTLTDAGRRFGRDRTTAAHACTVVEERREDPCVDMIVECLERAVESPGSRDEGGRR